MKSSRVGEATRRTRIVMLIGIAALITLTVLVGAAVLQAGQCGAPLGLRQERTVDLPCSLVSNGYELASYRCTVPAEPGMVYAKLNALLTGPEGRLLGRWDAPITYDAEGKATPKNSWGPLDTSGRLVDGGDGVFGAGDVFHLDSVQSYRFGGAVFTLSGECWSGSAVLA